MWQGAACSNRVQIEDMDGLEKALEPFEGVVEMTFDRHGKVGFKSGDESNDGGWPSTVTDDDGNEFEFDPVQLICPFMAEGAVLVMMQSGADKYREITGYARAYRKDGTEITICLDDIYQKAADAFGVDRISISMCSY